MDYFLLLQNPKKTFWGCLWALSFKWDFFPKIPASWVFYSYKKKLKKLYDPFLWMGFNCLKATATSRRQFTFYHSVPRNSWYSFYRPRKDEVDLGWRAESILWHPNFMKILRAYVLEKTRLPTDILAYRNTDTNIFSTLR